MIFHFQRIEVSMEQVNQVATTKELQPNSQLLFKQIKKKLYLVKE